MTSLHHRKCAYPACLLTYTRMKGMIAISIEPHIVAPYKGGENKEYYHIQCYNMALGIGQDVRIQQ